MVRKILLYLISFFAKEEEELKTIVEFGNEFNSDFSSEMMDENPSLQEATMLQICNEINNRGIKYLAVWIAPNNKKETDYWIFHSAKIPLPLHQAAIFLDDFLGEDDEIEKTEDDDEDNLNV